MNGLKKGKSIFIVEGEKDVHTLETLGRVATTNPMGAGKWRETYSKILRGADVILIPDNDKKGYEHMQKVASSLEGKIKSLKIVELAGLPPKGDITDWVESGGTQEELEGIIEAAPTWTSDSQESFVSSLLKSKSQNAPGSVSWDEPKKLPPLIPITPDLPPSMLPEPLREWLVDVAERLNVPHLP